MKHFHIKKPSCIYVCLILHELTMAQFITSCYPHSILNTSDLFSNFNTVRNFIIQNPAKSWIRREVPTKIRFTLECLLVIPLSQGIGDWQQKSSLWTNLAIITLFPSQISQCWITDPAMGSQCLTVWVMAICNKISISYPYFKNNNIKINKVYDNKLHIFLECLTTFWKLCS